MKTLIIMCIHCRMASSKLALLLVVLSCIESCLSASCIVDSFTVKDDFDPKRVSQFKTQTNSMLGKKQLKYFDWLSPSYSCHYSMQGSGTHCRRKIQRAFSYRTTSLQSTPLMMTAAWPLPPRDVSLCLGKSDGQVEISLTSQEWYTSYFTYSQ